MTKTFSCQLAARPVRLERAVREVVRRVPPSGQAPQLTDMRTVINSFARAVREAPEREMIQAWKLRRKDLRALAFYVANSPNDGPDGVGTMRSHLLVGLRKVLDASWSNRFIFPMVMALFNDPSDKTQRKFVAGRLKAYGGRRALILSWRSDLDALLDVRTFAQAVIQRGGGIEETTDSYELTTTRLGRALLVEAVTNVVRMRKEGTTYRTELFGLYPETAREPSGTGLLSKLTPSERGPFINAYCSSLRTMPSPNDLVFGYLRQDTIMGNHKSLAWMAPEITDQARDVFRRWVLAKDFDLIFDEILRHQERKSYWLQWLPQIEDIQVWCPNSWSVNKQLKLDFQARELSLPTLAMKIGGCYLFECGEQGRGALYVYPSDGPVKWPTQLRTPRDYKGPALDHARIPSTWGRIAHMSDWQRRVDGFLRTYYGLMRKHTAR